MSSTAEQLSKAIGLICTLQEECDQLSRSANRAGVKDVLRALDEDVELPVAPDVAAKISAKQERIADLTRAVELLQARLARETDAANYATVEAERPKHAARARAVIAAAIALYRAARAEIDGRDSCPSSHRHLLRPCLPLHLASLDTTETNSGLCELIRDQIAAGNLDPNDPLLDGVRWRRDGGSTPNVEPNWWLSQTWKKWRGKK